MARYNELLFAGILTGLGTDLPVLELEEAEEEGEPVLLPQIEHEEMAAQVHK